MVSISPFFAGGGGGDIQKLNAGILFQNLRGYIGWRAVGFPIEKTCLHQC